MRLYAPCGNPGRQSISSSLRTVYCGKNERGRNSMHQRYTVAKRYYGTLMCFCNYTSRFSVGLGWTCEYAMKLLASKKIAYGQKQPRTSTAHDLKVEAKSCQSENPGAIVRWKHEGYDTKDDIEVEPKRGLRRGSQFRDVDVRSTVLFEISWMQWENWDIRKWANRRYFTTEIELRGGQ